VHDELTLQHQRSHLTCKHIQQLLTTKAKTARLQQAECPDAKCTSDDFDAVSHLSHEMLHDAMESKDMATGSDLRAQWVCLQGYGTLHFATCHHDYLRKTCGRHVVCNSCQKMTFLQCQRSMSIALHASCFVTDILPNDCLCTC